MSPWLDFIFAKVICRANSDQYTVAIGLWKMLEKEYIDSWYTSFAAGAVLISIPIAILFLSLQKFYVDGVSGCLLYTSFSEYCGGSPTLCGAASEKLTRRDGVWTGSYDCLFCFFSKEALRGPVEPRTISLACSSRVPMAIPFIRLARA